MKPDSMKQKTQSQSGVGSVPGNHIASGRKLEPGRIGVCSQVVRRVGRGGGGL